MTDEEKEEKTRDLLLEEIKMLDGISDQDITEFNIPTGVPILYELDDNLGSLGREFLGDAEAIKKAAAAVAQQAAGK